MKRTPLQALQQAYFFQDLPEPVLQELFQSAKQQTYQPGQAVLRQETRTDGLYFILDGEIQLSRTVKDHTAAMFSLEGEDILGEVEFFFSDRRMITARAVRETSVLFWEKDVLESFLQDKYDTLQRLLHSARSRRLAFQQRFSWLADGEAIHVLSRRHPIHLLSGLILPVLLLVLSIPLAVRATNDQLPALLWLALFLGLFGSGWTGWRILDYQNDFFILTNQRAIWLEKVIGLYERRKETPLQWVLSSGASSTFTGRMLGYSDIHIRTYTGQMELVRVPDPALFTDQLDELWSRRKKLQNEVDRDQMLDTIAQRLTDQPGELEPFNLPDTPAPDRSESQAGLDQWSFRTRFETDGVISYRKHWAVLLRGLLLPLVLAGFSITAIILQLAGRLSLFEDENLLMFAFPMAVIFVFWCVYRYVDWVNEIYQITPVQIIDIHKKPLGQETRRVAPLENILGTEVNQRGIFGLLLNFGDVSAQIGTSQFTFEGVLNPNGVQQDIVRAQNAFLQRRSKNEQAQRQMEVVEWLSAYHEGTKQQHAGSHEPQSENDHDPSSRNNPGPGPAPEGPQALPGDR